MTGSEQRARNASRTSVFCLYEEFGDSKTRRNILATKTSISDFRCDLNLYTSVRKILSDRYATSVWFDMQFFSNETHR